MKKLTMIVTLLGTTLLCGCFEDKPKKSVTPQKVVVEITQPKKEEIHTVTWFKEHQEERVWVCRLCISVGYFFCRIKSELVFASQQDAGNL